MIKSINEPAGARDVMLTPNSINEPLPASEIVDNLPPPKVTGLDPASCEAGAEPFTMTVTGTDFLKNAVVTINTVPLPTTYVSGTKLTAEVETAGVVAGDYPVTVQVGPLEAQPAMIFTVREPVSKRGKPK